MSHARRALLFLLLLPLAYVLALVLLSFSPLEFHRAVAPEHDAWRRFAEAETRGKVDVLVLGSSHAYRSFDPRAFRARGLETFNLGSTSQSPLNTFHLLAQHLDRLDPEIMVLTVCHDVLKSPDGLESFLNIAANAPWSREVHLRMALATRNLYALNHLALVAAERLHRPLAEARPPASPEQVYVPGGYVETRRGMGTLPRPRPPRKVETAEVQWEYLARILEKARARGIRVLLVGVPVADEDRARVANYAALAARVSALAAAHGAEYRDFNGTLPLETREHFMDEHHLNAAGVGVFERAFLDTLEAFRGRAAAGPTAAAGSRPE